MKRVPPPCVLVVAGSDSGGGAGVQADARAIHALGGFACMAITAITAQNLRGVRAWEPVSPALIAAQIKAVLGSGAARGLRTSPSRKNVEEHLPRAIRPRSGIRAGSATLPPTAGYGDPALHQAGALPVRAIKTGLIPGAAAVRAIARALEPHRAIPLVIDPVMGSTTGTLFLDPAGIRALRRELLPRATLVTPNWPEAEALSGIRLHSFTDAERAARALAQACGCAVLVKGGHAAGNVCRDCLVLRNGDVHWFESPRVETPNTHGTGCVLASAIATELAKGAHLERAVSTARRFLQEGLRGHRRVEWDGAGPAFPGG